MKIIYGSIYEVAKTYAYLFINEKKIKYQFEYSKNAEDILNVINQTSLFEEESSNGLYLIYHADFLTDKTKGASNFITNLLNTDKEIICIVGARALTSFNPTVTNNKKVEFIKAKKFTNQDKFKLIDNMLKTYPINFDCETTKTNFINCFANDPNLIINEIKKASSYSFDSEFTNDTINHLVTQNANDTIFDLVDFILLNKKAEALNLLDNLLKKKIQPITIIQVMASQLFDLKLQKMYMIRYSNNPYLAQKILGINPYVILMHQEILTKSPISKIKKMLNSLSLLDYNIKNNLVIGDISLKTFVVEN